MPELLIKAMEGVGVLRGSCQLTVSITPIQDVAECFVVCACGWRVAHYLPMKRGQMSHALARSLYKHLAEDLREHGNLQPLHARRGPAP